MNFRFLTLVSAAVVLLACKGFKDAMTAHVDVAAKAGSQELSVERLSTLLSKAKVPVKLHTMCATCGEAATHTKALQAEVWADIHEFEHTRHLVRCFEQVKGEGLKEVVDWRGIAS